MESLGDAWAGISSAAAALVGAGEAGFSLSENGAKPILNAIDDLLENVSEALRKGSVLERVPALGGTPNALVYKPFLATVATDPVQGAIPALRRLQQDLTDARRVINQAMINYQNGEQQVASGLKGIPT